MNKKDFYFDLPESLIAQSPLKDRDSARLLVLDKKTGNICHKYFRDIIDYINPNDCIVINDTKVLPARLIGEKENSGAKIEFLLLKRIDMDLWETLVKPGKRAKIGSKIIFGNGLLKAEIVDIVQEGNRIVKFNYDGIFEEILDKLGQMPLPPYITEKLKDKNMYQTVYAKNDGSAAAPTAGLHFTPELIENIKKKGVKFASVTLHVGLGTFRPVKADNILDHKMHSEFYSIKKEQADIINQTKKNGGKIISVGTTSTRTLETAADENGFVKYGSGWTDIFIYPKYNFKIIDSLITNFHLPESTLIMLVSALAGRENVLNAYNIAVKEKYRFFSFGDAMFILEDFCMRDDILMRVEKPARYIGNEINIVKKNPENVDIRFAFCFPDVYEVGMSHVGLQILYYFFNRRNDMYCERCFAPWYDMEDIMRKESISLFALETGDPLSCFDFIGFTLQYEMSFTNVINMINLANIPIWAKDRGDDCPIIIAGGPCAYNPEPLADIIDIFYIGEGEVSYDELMDLYKENKKNGGTKTQFLEMALKIEGIYIPKFYDVTYKENGQIASFLPNHKDAPEKIRKVIVKDLDSAFYPEKQLVPLIETVHDRVTMEVFRGCIRGCRFCQAGYVYRPVRERSAENLLKKADNLVKFSGHEEISLTSLSTGDYRDFKNLAEGLINKFSDENINISLPSLRVDAFSLDLMNKVQKVRKSSLTFAPEAGTQRLRDVINKGITEEEILNGCYIAFEGGWNRVKLYFMVGLPTETEDDLIGISKLSSAIVDKYYEIPKDKRNKGLSVIVSSSCFVPKPFTPFQWFPQATFKEFMEKQKLVKTSIERKQIKFNYHEVQLSSMEGVLARGDRRVSKAIVKAWQKGAKFDGWNDLFKYNIWAEAFDEVGLDMAFYANRQRSYDEILPWDFISIGIPKSFFISEMEKALNGEITLNCRTKCAMCGAKSFGGGVCYEVQS